MQTCLTGSIFGWVICTFAAMIAAAAQERNTSDIANDSIAAAYQRAVFILNLNPSPWDQVYSEAETIARALSPFDERQANQLLAVVRAVETARSVRQPDPQDADLPVNPEESEIDIMPQGEAARQVFVAITRATAAVVIQGLDRAIRAKDPDRSALLRTARDAFDGFTPTLRTCDPDSLSRMEAAWRDLMSPGSPSSQANSADIKAALIRDYFQKHFGPGYTVSNTPRLTPIPTAGPTLQDRASEPVSLPPGSRVSRPMPRPRQLLNSVERGALERDMTLSSLGAAAFNNPLIFGEPARTLRVSCNTCHEKSGNNPGFFIPGLSSRPGNVDVSNSFFAPHGNNAVFDPLDIPDLRGIRFTAPYGRNGRFASLREFTRNVIVNEFNGDEPDPILLDAMVIYMNEFDFLVNPALNPDGTLNTRASAAALRGEKLFNKPFKQFNNRSCATCHIPSANFLDHQRHDIGTVEGASEFSRDRSLDTPTLLGAAVTAPYFHDGSQPTLAAVVAWFNRRHALGLTDAEAADLTSYLSTIGNGIHAHEVGDQFLLEDMEDQDSFLAAYEFLESKSRWGMIKDLFGGIGMEVRRQVPLAQNPQGAKMLAKLADMMDGAARNATPENRDLVNKSVRDWRELSRQSKFSLP
jgi:cytochrome c peroxidase